METSEEENFGVAVSSPSDAEFDAVVGYLEDIIMDDDFQSIQRTFMEKHYQEFDDSEENKLIYTSIFNEYISLIEKYIEEKLLDRIPGFNMTAFTMSLQQHKDEMAGDIFDMLLTFTDFLAFKEMFFGLQSYHENLHQGSPGLSGAAWIKRCLLCPGCFLWFGVPGIIGFSVTHWDWAPVRCLFHQAKVFFKRLNFYM
uniref:ADP-ribosylation factor-like protein 2-binding protein n=1 Tax=Gallus gallus TaxID=9031 RepID=A0A8V0ZUH1_CHICK